MAYLKTLVLPTCQVCGKTATQQVHNQWNAPLPLTFCNRHRKEAERVRDRIHADERAAAERGDYTPRLGSAR